MKKLIVAFLFAAMLAPALFAAGSKEAAAPSAVAKPIVMKIGHAQPVTHPRHESLLKFKELVEARSNGGIIVEIYPAAQLGDEAAMLDATKLGTLQATRGGLFERVSPRLLTYTLPFLFDNLDGLEKVTMGPIGEKIAAEAEKNGLLVLTTGDAGGFRQITNNTRPIVKPEDLKGLKIRAPGVKTIVKTLEAFGANVVTIPYGETYMALKTGVADGQENPFVNIEAMKFYEVQKYLTVVDYQFHPDPFNVNPAWFRSLSPEHQKIVKDAAVESMKYNNQLNKIAGVKAFEVMKNALQVTVLTPAQRQAFKDKANEVYAMFIAEGVTTQAEIDAIKAAAK
jgi:tripartite ATP-independent transporter DctP family solute receptor